MSTPSHSSRSFAASHHELETRLSALAAMAASTTGLATLAEAWKSFQSELTHHLDDEEKHLFGRPDDVDRRAVNALVQEHRFIRDCAVEIGIDISRAGRPTRKIRNLDDILRAHARTEEELFGVVSGLARAPNVSPRSRAAPRSR